MQKDLQTKIYDDFKPMFEERHLPMTKTAMCWGIDVGSGWATIIYETCKKLKSIVSDDFRFIQVKEKFGALEMYTNFTDKKINEIIDNALEESLKTCEECGEKGRLIRSKSGWLRTRCEECYDFIPEELK